MPVGTAGSVKAIAPDDLRAIGAQIILGNTYHLLLRPGAELVAEMGGLHRFMAWDGCVLTDSGGFQVYSLAEKRKITEEGALFASHLDGRRELDLPGYALGGYSVGEKPQAMWEGVEASAELLPSDKPRYLMGVGTPEDLLRCALAGVDLFDCVLPTRVARNGLLLTRQGRLQIKSARYARDPRPADEGCRCYTCRTFTRAYLRHLFAAQELLSYRLNTLHNLTFYLDLMRGLREAIAQGTAANYIQQALEGFAAGPD